MDRDYIDLLANRIQLPQHTKGALDAYLNRHAMAVDSMADQVRKNKGWIDCLKKEMCRRRRHEDRYLFALAVVMVLTEDTLSRYRKKGIPDDIFYDTMHDITIWSNNCNRDFGLPGIENLNWIQNHLVPNIYRIGRLQYQFSEVYFPTYVQAKELRRAPVRRKEPCINIHIPAGMPLDEAECTDSIEASKRFFGTFYPDYNYRYYFCESWLLDPQNHNVMQTGSNILKFAERFEIVSSHRYNQQAIEWIFGERKKDVTLYPENTTLQRNVKKYLAHHGKLGIAVGIFPK